MTNIGNIWGHIPKSLEEVFHRKEGFLEELSEMEWIVNWTNIQARLEEDADFFIDPGKIKQKRDSVFDVEDDNEDGGDHVKVNAARSDTRRIHPSTVIPRVDW